jgi:hypothetical protein
MLETLQYLIYDCQLRRSRIPDSLARTRYHPFIQLVQTDFLDTMHHANIAKPSSTNNCLGISCAPFCLDWECQSFGSQRHVDHRAADPRGEATELVRCVFIVHHVCRVLCVHGLHSWDILRLDRCAFVM